MIAIKWEEEEEVEEGVEVGEGVEEGGGEDEVNIIVCLGYFSSFYFQN